MSAPYASPHSPKAPEPHRTLRMVVIGMGIILIVGTILLAVLAFQKMRAPGDAAADAAANTQLRADLPRGWKKCGMHDLVLEKQERIERIDLADMHITRIVTRLPDNQWRIYKLHSCSGTILGRLHIQSDPDARTQP